MKITPRRLQVLQIMSGGSTDAECGEVLFISSATVRNHVAQMLPLTGFSRRRKMLAWVRDAGFATLDVAAYESWIKSTSNGLPPSNS